MEDLFRFKQFSVRHRDSALKLGTDAVILGAAMSLPEPIASVNSNPKRALDIGTGCGVIALMLAQRAGDYHITGIDIDQPSASEAAFNFSQSPWAERLEAKTTALADYRPECRFDLIFSNPPYYDSSLKNPDEREAAARHTDSLEFKEIFAFAAEYLSSDGQLSLILPHDCLKSIIRLSSSFGLYPFRILSVHTVERKPAKRAVIEFSRKKCFIQEEKLVLQRGSERSEEYSSLCSEFYL